MPPVETSSPTPATSLVDRRGLSPASRGFVLAFQVHCDHCLFQDFVKVGNTGWQGGTHSQALEM